MSCKFATTSLYLLCLAAGSVIAVKNSATSILADLIASRSSSSNSSIVKQFERIIHGPGQRGADFQYQTNVDLIFAELQANLLATNTANEFFHKASRFGLPSTDNLLFRDNYILSFDNRLRHPNWVLEHLCDLKIKLMNAPRHPQHMFSPDKTLHEYFRTTNDDYKYCGYNRGHLSPVCNNRASATFVDQSFCLSNVAPQVNNLNQGFCPWSRLEKYVHYLVIQSKNTYIITGTLYLPEGANPLDWRWGQKRTVSYRLVSSKRIGVPTHFYKVVLTESHSRQLTMEAFMIANSVTVSKGRKINRLRIDIDKQLPLVERAAGLNFFSFIDRSKVAKPDKLQFEYPD